MLVHEPNNSFSLGIVFLHGYLDTDQKLAQFQPSQKQQYKSSHQGKLSSLRDVPWPHLYLHIIIYIPVAHRGCADQGPSVLSTVQTGSMTLFLLGRAGAHNSGFTPWWSDLPGATQQACGRAESRTPNPGQCLAPISLASPSEKLHLLSSTALSNMTGSDWAFLKAGQSQQPEPHWAGVLTLLLQALLPRTGSLQPPKQTLGPFSPNSSNS